jgi:hypothetical protein
MPPDEHRAPVAIDWYRTPIAPDLFRRLHQRSDMRGLAQSLGFLGIAVVPAATALWAQRHGHWGWALLALFGYGMVAHFYVNAMHELSHGTAGFCVAAHAEGKRSADRMTLSRVAVIFSSKSAGTSATSPLASTLPSGSETPPWTTQITAA